MFMHNEVFTLLFQSDTYQIALQFTQLTFLFATGRASKEDNSVSGYENILVLSLKEIMNDDSFRI